MNLLTAPNHKKNINLNTAKTKSKILNYLSGHIDHKSKPCLIKNEQDLDRIRDQDYIICPQIDGIRSWIVFVKLDDCYYAVNFPKNTARDNNIPIHPVGISVGKEFYAGTIMEGTFYAIDENKYIIIDEVYLFAGQNQLLKPKDDRLNYLSGCFSQRTMRNETYRIYVSEFYQTDKEDLAKLYDKVKSDTKISDIIFYPKNYGKKIYIYSIIDTDLIDDEIKFTTFFVSKTKNTDVYNLSTLDTKKKMGIAYIPDQETSKNCKNWFKNKKTKEVIAKCKWNQEKKKWIPIEVIEEDIENGELNIDSE